MDVKLSIGEEEVGMNNSIEEEVNKDEGGASMEMLEDELDSLKEEDIWRSRRERMNKLVAARTAVRQERGDLNAIYGRLVDVIKGADVEEFISVIERLADQIDTSAIFNFQGLWRGSLLHIAAGTGKDDILRLLVNYIGDHLIAGQNDLGDTPLHMAAKAGGTRAAAMLIRRARDLLNMEDKNLILRMKNKHGNTALHEAVLHHHVDMVRFLLREDLEPVYWRNTDQKSPLFLALDINDLEMREVLFSLSLEPSRIQGLPPIHGAILRGDYGTCLNLLMHWNPTQHQRLSILVECYEDLVPNLELLIPDLLYKILEWNKMLFVMTDSRGGNVFHLAAYKNEPRVFGLLLSQAEYLARERDMNGDLPIHIASKMGNVELIEKLHPISQLLNRQGQTVLHVAAKYGRALAVRYILRHPDLGILINERDNAGNTALHLAAKYSQPAAAIPLLQDKRIQLVLLNHKCLTALEVALHCHRRGPTFRKLLALKVLDYVSAASIHIFVLRPEAQDKVNPWLGVDEVGPNLKHVKDATDTRLLVATLVATVTFAAGFAVPGGFNSSDTASKDDQGMATMLDKRMFHAFVICNSMAMFCSMTAVVTLMLAQQTDVHLVSAVYQYSKLPLIIALSAMSAAFLTGVTLTVGKLPWLANAIFYLGLIFLLIISGSAIGSVLLQCPPWFRSHRRSTRRLLYWHVLAYIYLLGVETYLLDDAEEDGAASGTTASLSPDGAGESNHG